MKAEKPGQSLERKVYVKPQVEKVRLMTGETMVNYCRSLSVQFGPLNGATACNSPTPCSDPLPI